MKILLVILNVKKEQFFHDIKRNNTITIKFLKKKEGCDVFKSSDKYFSKFSEMDYKARNIPSKDTILDYYCNNTINFTKREQQAIIAIIQYFNENISDKRYNFILKDWKFCKVTNIIENSYPHTHGDTIFISQSFMDKLFLKNKHNKNEIRKLVKQYGYILIHEKVHVWQRQDPDTFHTLYEKYWNFKKADKINNLESLSKLSRNNPDGLYLNYVYHTKNNEYILLLCNYDSDSEDSVRLSDVKYIGVYLDKIGEKEYTTKSPLNAILINNIPELNSFFYVTNNNYHPHELSAEIISHYYLNLMNLSKYKNKYPAIIKIDEWFKNIL